MTTTTRAAIYTRVSSDDQAAGGTSLGTQAERCQAYAAERGWELVSDSDAPGGARDVFEDGGESGAKARRPALDRLLAAVARGEVDALVVAKWDRLGRSLNHLTTLWAQLDLASVEAVSLGDPETSGRRGRFVRNVLASVAEEEREAIRERTTLGRVARLRQGGWSGGEPPLGFRVQGTGRDARLVLDDHEAAMVRRAVALLLDHGMTTGQAASALNSEGYLPRRAPLWTAALLRTHLMRGPWGGVWTYAKPASRRQGRDLVPEPITVAVPQLLDAERHAALLVYVRTTASAKTRKVVHPLSGLLVGECGHPYTGVARGDRGRRRYRCRYMTDQGRGWSCDAPTILADSLDDMVWAEVVALVADPQRLLSAAAERLGMLDSAQAVTADALERAEAEVAKLERSLGEVFARGVRMGLDEAALREATTSLEASLVDARQHAAMVAAMRAESQQERGRLDRVRELAELAGSRLVDADAELRARWFGLLGVQVRVPLLGEEGRPLRVDVTGTVAHDVLLGDLTPSQPGDLSPRSPGARGAGVPFAVTLAVA